MSEPTNGDAPAIDDVASRALAAILLENVADAINDGGNQAAKALKDLAADTGLSLDVAAGILYAMTSLTAAGGLESEAVFALSLTYSPEDTETLEGEPS